MEVNNTESLIPKTLAKEFTLAAAQIQAALALLDQGLQPPYISRVQREEVGDLSESQLRRIAKRRDELLVVELRKGNILRSLRAKEDTDPRLLKAIEGTMDRFELEDLFVAHRRPEIEVQRALDHGLLGLADRLVERLPKPTSKPSPSTAEGEAVSEAPAPEAADASIEAAPEAASEAPLVAKAEVPVEAPAAEAAAPAEEAPAPEAPKAEAPAAEAPAAEAPAAEAPKAEAPKAEAPKAEAPKAEAPAAEAPAAEAPKAEAPKAKDVPTIKIDLPSAAEAPDGIPSLHHGLTVTPELARVCAEFVNTDRDVHSEEQALDGAMRLLSDRLGRNARLRGQIRKLLRKEGFLTVRETGSGDAKRIGRYKSLLKSKSPLRQLQPHTLIALRQAQKERVLTTDLHHSGNAVLERVRGALGRHTRPEFESVLDAISRRALERRLMPMIEPDIRLELKERGDSGALLFLSKYLRRQLLGLPGGARATLGVNVNARGAWVIVRLDEAGQVFGAEVVIETKDRPIADVAKDFEPLLGEGRCRTVAIGAGKSSQAAVQGLREALKLIGSDAFVFVINESGLSAWANSASARAELSELTVPARQAAGLARRFQDPLAELLKAEPRHLVHGIEHAHVSKAALARVLEETIQSCVAFVGCDANTAPLHVLSHLPGLTKDGIAKLVARRAEAPFKNREELREVLEPVEFQNAAAFLQVRGGDTPLDGTGLHPEQYPIVKRILEESGRVFDDVFGQPGGLKGLKRAKFGIDEVVWRDIVRELARPGRDPRPRIYIPRLFTPDTDPASLEKGQLVEGVVTNVANFGAFLDIGLTKDAMVHVSDATSRYVRDAREIFAVGDVVRAKVLAAAGPRLTLTLKGVGMDRPRHGAPKRERRDRDDRGGRGGSGGGGRREREDRGGPKTTFDPNLRAAQTRRDGLVVGSGSPARGRKPGRGGGPGRGDKRGRDRDERFDRRDLDGVTKEVKFNPFANFFKDEDGEGDKG